MEDEFNYDTMVPEEPSGNRTFWRWLIAILGILILSILGILLWVFVLSPRQEDNQAAQATQTAAAQTEMAVAQLPTITNTPWPSNTPEPTFTQAATQTAEPPAQVPTSTPTIEPTDIIPPTPTPTALPTTGFADDISLPGLISLGCTLVLIVFVARRIRVWMTN